MKTNIQNEVSEAGLREVCRYLEFCYVERRDRALHGGFAISTPFPWKPEPTLVEFVTTRKRSIRVRKPDGQVLGEVKMLPGMARELYAIAGVAL